MERVIAFSDETPVTAAASKTREPIDVFLLVSAVIPEQAKLS
jgi:hypothetical protein